MARGEIEPPTRADFQAGFHLASLSEQERTMNQGFTHSRYRSCVPAFSGSLESLRPAPRFSLNQ